MILTDHYIYQFAEVKQIFSGGCIQRGEGSRFRSKAHAHTTGEHKGTICIMLLRRASDMPLMLHEAAHLITGCGHTDKWRKKLLEIGGTLDEVKERDGKGVLLRSYQKKSKIKV